MLPTWLVVQRHSPIEHDKTEARSENQSEDKEQGLCKMLMLLGKGLEWIYQWKIAY